MRLTIILTVSLLQIYSSNAKDSSSESSISSNSEENSNKTETKSYASNSPDNSNFKDEQPYISDDEIKFDKVIIVNDGDDINNKPYEDISNFENFLSEENNLRLKYQALNDENNIKNNKVKGNKELSSESKRQKTSPQVFNNKRIFYYNAEKKKPDNSRILYPRMAKTSDESQENMEKILELKMGGYQRPFGERNNNPNSERFENQRLNEDEEKDMILNQNRQAPYDDNIFIQRNIKYHPLSPFSNQYFYSNIPSEISSPIFSQRNMQTQQLNDNSLSDYNLFWLDKLRSDEARTLPSGLSDMNPMLPIARSGFALPSMSASQNPPINSERSPMSTAVYEQRNTYPISPNFQRAFAQPHTYNREFINNQRYTDPSVFYLRNPMELSVPFTGLDDKYRETFPVQFAYQPSGIVNRGGIYTDSDVKPTPVNRSDNVKESENEEDNSETANQSKDSDSKSKDESSYLNYPRNQAGYGTQEKLPSQNSTKDSTKTVEIPKWRPINIPLFPTNFYQTTFPLNRPKSFPDNPFFKSNNKSSEENFPENLTKSFNDEEFYKSFQMPIHFNYPKHDLPKESTNFFSFSDKSLRNDPPSFIQNPFFFYQKKNEKNDTTKAPRPSHLMPFEFFPIYNTKSIKEDETPSCALETNSSICFKDDEYPKEEISHNLDTEAFLLLKILPPTSDVRDSITETERSSEENNSNICSSTVTKGRPLRAINTQGKWKIIVNLGDSAGRFKQDVMLEFCSDVGMTCSYTDEKITSRCVQKYTTQRLFAWNRERGLHSDIFKLPVSCSCQIVKK